MRGKRLVTKCYLEPEGGYVRIPRASSEELRKAVKKDREMRRMALLS